MTRAGLIFKSGQIKLKNLGINNQSIKYVRKGLNEFISFAESFVFFLHISLFTTVFELILCTFLQILPENS